jgi:predicted DNA-binding WGR domain protein
MRIFMQCKPAAKEAPRYYHLILQQDLLGGWTLIREWGQQGGRASMRRDVYLERDAAESALVTARDQQLRKGFQVMFMQGMDAPAGSTYDD